MKPGGPPVGNETAEVGERTPVPSTREHRVERLLQAQAKMDKLEEKGSVLASFGPITTALIATGVFTGVLSSILAAVTGILGSMPHTMLDVLVMMMAVSAGVVGLGAAVRFQLRAYLRRWKCNGSSWNAPGTFLQVTPKPELATRKR